MWKIISTVVAVVCLAAAGFLFWDGHQAADDADAASAQSRALTAQTKTTKEQEVKKDAAGAALDHRGDSIRAATTNLREQTSHINDSVANTLIARGEIISAINPVVNQPASAELRDRLNALLRGLADRSAEAAKNYERLRAASDALDKAAR